MKKVLLLFLAVAGITFTACESDEIDALNTQMIEGDAYLQYQIDNLVRNLEAFKVEVANIVTEIYNTIEDNKLIENSHLCHCFMSCFLFHQVVMNGFQYFDSLL